MITLKTYAVKTKNKMDDEYVYSVPFIFKDNEEAAYYITEATKDVPYKELILEHIADYDPKTGVMYPIEEREPIDLINSEEEKGEIDG